MGHYLDIETSSLLPGPSPTEGGKIVTIQYQKLSYLDNKPIAPLVILKAWESSEKEILEKFSEIFNTGGKWDFAPCYGYNMFFEEKWLRERCIANGLPPIELFSKPSVDLHVCGIMMNKGAFKNSGLDKISNKDGNGALIIEAIEEKDYAKIEEYIIQETKAYIELLVYLTKNMYKVLEDFQTYISNAPDATRQ